MLEEEFVYPQYDGRSLYNVVPTIFALFDIKDKRKSLPIGLFKKYINKNNKIIFFLIDGFGFNHYETFSKELEFFKHLTLKGDVFSITSIFPSTTASCLTTLATGLAPCQHGLFEWNMYIKELDRVIQTLPFCEVGKNAQDESLKIKGISPHILLDKNIKTTFQLLSKNGVKSYVFLQQSIANSTYSLLVSQGAVIVPYTTVFDLFPQIVKVLNSEKGPAFLDVYFGDIDSAEHKFGPYSKEHILELRIFFEELGRGFVKSFNKEAARNITAIITSDHGQINIDPKKTIYLNRDKKIIKSLALSKKGKLIPPWGSPRDVFLATSANKKEEVFDYLVNKYKKEAKIIKTEEAIKMGLFGPPEEGVKPSRRFLERAGDILILPYGGETIWYEHVKGDLLEFLGHHGGLSKEEMLVPFGIVRLEDLS